MNQVESPNGQNKSIGISINVFQGSSPSSSSLQHGILPSDDFLCVEHMLITAWWFQNNKKFGSLYLLDRARTLSLKPGRGWMWRIVFRRIGILETCSKGQHVRGNLTDSNWWTSVWKIVELISKTNADTINHHIIKNETRNGWTCRDHAGTA